MRVYLVEDSHMKHVFWQGILHVLMLDPKRVVLDENEKTTQKVVCRHNKLQCSVLLAINLFPHVSSSLSFLVGLFDELTNFFEYRAEVEQNKSVRAKFFIRISYFYEHCQKAE